MDFIPKSFNLSLINHHQAKAALNTHVPASGMMGSPNIFMPTPVSTQQASFTPYSTPSPSFNTPPVPQPQQPAYNYSNYQQNNNASFPASANAYNTQQPRPGEAFLEISSDSSNPAWPQQGSYDQNQDSLMGWFSNVGNKVFEKTKVQSPSNTLLQLL